MGGFLVEGAGNVNDGGFLDGGPGYVMGGLNDLLGGFLLLNAGNFEYSLSKKLEEKDQSLSN